MKVSLYQLCTREEKILFVHKHDKTSLELNDIVEGCRLKAKTRQHEDNLNLKTLKEHFTDEMYLEGFEEIYIHNYYIKEI